MNKQEQTIQSYLLGELPESEAATLERGYFNDPQLFEQVVDVENDLVDRYARGLLPPPARERFERYYLNHPHRAERARFAEALQTKLDQVHVATAGYVHAETWFERLSALFSGPRLAWTFSIALLLAAVITGWSLFESRRLRRELAQADSDRVAREERERELRQQVTAEQMRAENLSQELQRLQQEAVPSKSPEDRLSASLATLVLAIGGTRASDGGPPPVLRIARETEQVKFQLNLSENNYSRYQAVLQSADGKTILTSKQMTAIRKETGANLAVVLPARMFPPGDYMLTLKGVTKTGDVEDVSKSLFRVERQ